MDEVLKRIEMLLPRKPDGSLVHGCKKALTDHLKLPSNTMAEWFSGRNKSYRNYIAQIAEYYGVSANWILGLTDEKGKSPVSEETELDKKKKRLVESVLSMNDEQIALFQALIDQVKGNNK